MVKKDRLTLGNVAMGSRTHETTDATGVPGKVIPDEDSPKQVNSISRLQLLLHVFFVLLVLFAFLVSVKALGMSFRLFGKGFAEMLIRQTSNPFVGLFVGVLSTSLLHSSSTTTCMVVAFVASGTLSVETATPIVMGANIGSTSTGLLVSFTYITRKSEFSRAYAAATVHDNFNLLTVILLLPLELTTGFLHRSATYLAGALTGSSTDLAFQGPLAVAVTPVAALLKSCCVPLGHPWHGVVLAILSVAGLACSLVLLTRIMKRLLLAKADTTLRKALESVPAVGLLVGMLVTAIIQSSGVTVSLMIPLAAAGVLNLEQIFPVALGANVGTTVTALLASLTGNVAGLTIALTHLLFNVTGILIFYPFSFMRRIPIAVARFMGRMAARSIWYPILYVGTIFFAVPALLIFVWRNM